MLASSRFSERNKVLPSVGAVFDNNRTQRTGIPREFQFAEARNETDLFQKIIWPFLLLTIHRALLFIFVPILSQNFYLKFFLQYSFKISCLSFIPISC